MGTPPIPLDVQRRIKEAIEDCLREGFDPYRQNLGGRGSSVSEASRRLIQQGYDADTNNRIASFVRQQEKLKARGDEHMCPDWSIFQKPGVAAGAVRSGVVHRWLLTSAQDDTRPHMAFWSNLKAFSRYIDADILVAPFTYNKGVYTDHQTRSGVYHPEFHDHLRFEPFECGPVLFCAEMNILPTAVTPLSGLDTYSRGRSAVFPHAKRQLVSIPAMPGAQVPIIQTTGTATIPNYIGKKAGLKAQFHHVLGATLVEVNDKGEFWTRQINADDDGSFQDLDKVVRDGQVSAGNRVKSIVWGDIHTGTLPSGMAAFLWGWDPTNGSSLPEAMLDALNPSYQFFHDLLDFPQYSRHTDGDWQHLYRMWAQDRLCMESHVQAAVAFLRGVDRPWCQSVIVESNHDMRLVRWTKTDGRSDPVNAGYWHRCNLAVHDADRDQDEDFSLARWALRQADEHRLDGIDFVPVGGSFLLCQDKGGGVEHGSHGDIGPNGARGSVNNLARTATKAYIGHSHSAAIRDGVYQAGISGSLDQDYNKGPSSWSHSHIVTYPNAKRTIITQSESGAWRA